MLRDGEAGEAPEEHGQGPKIRRRLSAGAGAQTKRARRGRAGRPVVPHVLLCRVRPRKQSRGTVVVAAAAYVALYFSVHFYKFFHFLGWRREGIVWRCFFDALLRRADQVSGGAGGSKLVHTREELQ